MKKISVFQGQKALSFIVSNKEYDCLMSGIYPLRQCLTESQQKRLDQVFTAWEYSHLDFELIKEWSWTVDEMLDDIQDCGGYDNFGRLTPYEIYQWVKEQYPCTKANGMRVAEICSCGLTKISVPRDEFLVDPMFIR